MIDTTVFQNKTAVYYTLGCKLNFSETSTIGKILREAGVRTARKGEKADICVVNTCSVTEMADKKCRQAIHRLVKQHPGAFVVVTGCYAQLKPGDVAKIDGVDVVLGAEQKGELLQYLGDLQKHEKGEAITTTTKDIRSFSRSLSDWCFRTPDTHPYPVPHARSRHSKTRRGLLLHNILLPWRVLPEI